MNYDYLFKHSSKNQYYVYVYLNPHMRGHYDSITSTLLFEPFYVGKGCRNRYRVHLSMKGKQHPFYNKINKIKSLGQDPFTVIVASFYTEQEAFDFEVQLIALYTSSGIQLTNLEPGGRIHGPGRVQNTHKAPRRSKFKGIPRSESVKQKISDSKLAFHPTAKHWLVVSPDGIEYRTKQLRQLIEYQLGFTYNNYKTLINVHLSNRNLVTSGRMKGWQIFALS